MIYQNKYRVGSKSHNIYQKIAFGDLYKYVYFSYPEFKSEDINRYHQMIYKVCRDNNFKIKTKTFEGNIIAVKRLI